MENGSEGADESPLLMQCGFVPFKSWAELQLSSLLSGGVVVIIPKEV